MNSKAFTIKSYNGKTGKVIEKRYAKNLTDAQAKGRRMARGGSKNPDTQKPTFVVGIHRT